MQQAQTNLTALGQVIDETWGRSSTPRTASSSVKFKVQGRTLLLATYQAVVNFGTERERIEMRRRYAEEALAITDAAVKRVRESYRTVTGAALKLSKVQSDDNLEMLGGSPFNPKRTALYKNTIVYELG